MIKSFKTIMFIVLAYIFATLVGCATPANYLAMTVEPAAAIHKNAQLKGKIAIANIFGGKKTNPLWSSQVDNESFRKALESSLSAYEYLSSSADKAKYKLDIDLLDLKQPFIGYNINVESKVAYKLYGAGETKNYMIKASSSATVSEEFFFNNRVKIANERSVKANIKEFLKQLSSF